MITAELKNPERDKNFSVHLICTENEEKAKILLAFHTIRDAAHHARPFLQGDSPFERGAKHWYMIEFWTFDLDQIILACEHVEKILGIIIKGLSSEIDKSVGKEQK